MLAQAVDIGVRRESSFHAEVLGLEDERVADGGEEDLGGASPEDGEGEG